MAVGTVDIHTGANVAVATMPPIEDRPPGNPGPPADLAVVQPGGDQALDFFEFDEWTHVLWNDEQPLRHVRSRYSPSVPLELSAGDRAMLDGDAGQARRIAMRIVASMAEVLDADRLIDVVSAHVDGCLYQGRASLDFAER